MRIILFFLFGLFWVANASAMVIDVPHAYHTTNRADALTSQVSTHDGYNSSQMHKKNNCFDCEDIHFPEDHHGTQQSLECLISCLVSVSFFVSPVQDMFFLGKGSSLAIPLMAFREDLSLPPPLAPPR